MAYLEESVFKSCFSSYLHWFTYTDSRRPFSTETSNRQTPLFNIGMPATFTSSLEISVFQEKRERAANGKQPAAQGDILRQKYLRLTGCTSMAYLDGCGIPPLLMYGLLALSYSNSSEASHNTRQSIYMKERSGPRRSLENWGRI